MRSLNNERYEEIDGYNYGKVKFADDHYGHQVFGLEVASNTLTYVVSLMVKVDDRSDRYDDYGIDKLTLRIDSTRNKPASGSDIRLVEYKQIISPQKRNP